MGVNTYQRDMNYYLKHRTPINAKCIKPGDEKDHEVRLCSKVIITDDPECYCQAYIHPDAKWRGNYCPLADSFLQINLVDQKKENFARVGQQKQSKKKKSRK
jgi:hypothetical protein